MKTMKQRLAPVLLYAALVSSASSSTLYFDGETDHNIQTAANWTGNVLPTAGTHAGIVGGSTNVFFSDRVIATLDITFEGTSSIGNIVTSATRLRDGTVFSFVDSSSWNNISQNVIIGYDGTATLNWDSSGTLSALGGAKLDVGRSSTPCFLNQSDGLIDVGGKLQVLGGSVYTLSGGSMSLGGVIDNIDSSSYIDLLTTGTTGTLSVVNGGADYTSALQSFIDGGQIRINGVVQSGYGNFSIIFDGSKTTISAGDASAQPPVINSFTAAPIEVVPDGSTTLSWSTTNADSLSIDQGVGDVTGMAFVSVVVAGNTTARDRDRHR